MNLCGDFLTEVVLDLGTQRPLDRSFFLQKIETDGQLINSFFP